MWSDNTAGTLQLGGITVLEESGGTVTAPNNLSVTGTISGTIGSTTTFPAGHIIKISHNELACNSTNHTNVTAYRSWTATNLSCSHTTALASAILLVEYHMQYHVFQEQTGEDTFGHTRIYDNRTGSYAESTTNPDGTNVGGRQMTTGWWNIDQGSLTAKRKITLTGIAAGTAVTFKVYGYKHSSNDTDGYVQYNGEGSFDPPYTADFTSTMTIMELSG